MARDELAQAIPAPGRMRAQRLPVAIADNVLAQFLGVTVALRRLGMGGAVDDPAQLARQRPRVPGRWLRATRVAEVECQHLPQHQAQRMHVAGRRGGITREQFRCRVAGREHAPLGPCATVVFVEQPGDAEIQHADRTVGHHQDVGGLEVTMHDQAPMGRRDDRAQGRKQRQHLLAGGRMAQAPGVERITVEVIHDQVRHAVIVDAAIDQTGDAGVVEAQQDVALATKIAQVLLAEDHPPQQLDRDRLVEVSGGALAEVDDALAALAQLAHEPERAAAAADERGRGGLQARLQARDALAHVLADPVVTQCFGGEQAMQAFTRVDRHVLLDPWRSRGRRQLRAMLEPPAQVAGRGHAG